MKGQVFHHGTRVRTRGGDWNDWSTSQAMTVPSAPFTTELASDHAYSCLESLGESRRFVAEMAVFGHTNQPIASREDTLELSQRRSRGHRGGHHRHER